MTHPLTHEIIEKLVEDVYETDFNDCDECEDNLFARAAADWQLEQCIAWLESLDGTQYKILAGMMREAMRSQEDNQ